MWLETCDALICFRGGQSLRGKKEKKILPNERGMADIYGGKLQICCTTSNPCECREQAEEQNWLACCLQCHANHQLTNQYRTLVILIFTCFQYSWEKIIYNSASAWHLPLLARICKRQAHYFQESWVTEADAYSSWGLGLFYEDQQRQTNPRFYINHTNCCPPQTMVKITKKNISLYSF